MLSVEIFSAVRFNKTKASLSDAFVVSGELRCKAPQLSWGF
jgi:hypothetical protein